MDSEHIRALVFDLDGVLVDTHELMRHAFFESYRMHCGRSRPPFERFLTHMGVPLEDILRLLELPPEMAGTYRHISRQCLSLVTVYHGVNDALEAAQVRGLRIGLMTGKDRQRTIELLERFGLRHYFASSVCGDDCYPGKPNPAGLLSLLTEMEARPKDAAMIGDSPIDIACARAAGVAALGARWGLTSHDDITLSLDADVIFTQPADFASWLTCPALRADRVLSP